MSETMNIHSEAEEASVANYADRRAAKIEQIDHQDPAYLAEKFGRNITDVTVGDQSSGETTVEVSNNKGEQQKEHFDEANRREMGEAALSAIDRLALQEYAARQNWSPERYEAAVQARTAKK